MGQLTKKPCPGGCGDIAPRRAAELCWNCREAIRKWHKQEETRNKEEQGVFEVEGEPTYPIWSIAGWWLEDMKAGYEPSQWQTDGAPEGRMWNSTSHDKMFREEVKRFEVVKDAREWIKEMLSKEKNTSKHASDPVLAIRFVRREVWCLTWFSHYTFDTGQTDREVLGSFQRYVDRTHAINARESKKVNGYWTTPYCLMGAEERWRWRGSGDDGDSDNRTDPPCRCRHCKEQGLVRIGH